MVTPYYKAPDLTVYHCDALQAYQQFEDSAFGLLFLDPPYNMHKAGWDTFASNDAFLQWLRTHAAEWQRLLAPNGSLYVCASPQLAWGVEGVLRERFNVLNRITWNKPDPYNSANKGASNAGRISKESLRIYYDNSEVIFFCEHYGADNIAKGEAGYAAKSDELRSFVFEPLRAYLAGEFERAGMLNKDGKIAANVACGFSASAGGMASRHYFSQSQWCLPTSEHYQAMRELLNATGGDYLRREYDYLRREYEDLRREYEDLRRPFNGTTERPFTSVWHYPTVQPSPGKHPCEKPYAMVRDVVLTSSREDMLCGDFFAGSGVFGRACRDNGRAVVLCDQDERWARAAVQRCLPPPLLRLIAAADDAPTARQGNLPGVLGDGDG